MAREPAALRPRLTTRALSLAVAAFHGLVLGLALTNEHSLPPSGWPLAVGLALNLLATGIAWLAPWLGGRLLMACAGLLGMAALAGGLAAGLGPYSLVPALGYAVPSLVVGALFCADGRAPARQRPEQPA